MIAHSISAKRQESIQNISNFSKKPQLKLEMNASYHGIFENYERLTVCQPYTSVSLCFGPLFVFEEVFDLWKKIFSFWQKNI